MSCEITQELLNEMLGEEMPDFEPIEPAERKGYLFKKAEAIIQIYGDGEKGEPKKTDRLLTNLDDKKVTLQLLENPPGFALKIRAWSKTSEEEGELNIAIREVETLWGENPASPDQLTTALKLINHLQISGLTPHLSVGEKWQYQRDRHLPFSYWSYEWDKRRFGP